MARRSRVRHMIKVELAHGMQVDGFGAMAPKTQKNNLIALIVLIVGGTAAVGGWWMSRPSIQPFVQEPGQAAYAEQSGLPIEKTNSVGIVMRLIPPGTYRRGSPLAEDGRRANERPHTVHIRHTIYMAATETTQQQYEEIMGANPSSVREGREHTPVDSMTFGEAVTFCNRLSEREGLEPVYEQEGNVWVAYHERNGYRLPLEAEWEYAARATTEDAFYTGPIEPRSQGRRNLWRAAWYSDTSRGRPREVGQREPNGWGLYDILGNVWEWCWDWYADYPLTSDFDLRGPERSNQGRVIRGGGWYDRKERCRVAYRRFHFPAEPLNILGFRVVRTVIPPDTWRNTPPE